MGPSLLSSLVAEDGWSSGDHATPLRKKPRIHFTEKTQVRPILLPSVRFKHLVGADSKKIDGIRDVQDVPLESSIDKLETVICSMKWSACREVKRCWHSSLKFESSALVKGWRSSWEVCSFAQLSRSSC
ncbi:hypothetical protein L3X38_028442 [Prunus dulcis]|uniref:Uncharacterized protein n=1 Tax=Prunus dulcis TaxID=3755 RepID=A0AAD4VPT8_PRUDU|nr:hypothetical protein L3X38_028442 [Prunus dulcis]